MTNKNISTVDDVYRLLDEGKDLSSKVSFTHPTKTNGKAINLSLGKVWFNLLLPDDFELIDYPVNKPELDKILSKLYEKYGEEACDYISKLQEEAFKLTTIVPSSFKIDGFIIPKELQKKKEEFVKKADNMSIEEFQKEAEKLTKEYVKFFKSKKVPIQYVLDGKVKGDPFEQIRNLLVAKGFVVDIEGNISPKPIKHGIAEGYSKEEYALAGAEARKNFFLKASMTAVPGYLARKITTACANVQLNGSDCKTKTFFELKVDKKLAECLIGRFFYDNGKLKEITDPSEIVNKTIKLRSPLYCKSQEGICEKCYGTLAKNINTKNIGILAGGAINAVALNALMKMRHKASKIEIEDVNFIDSLKQFSIPKDIFDVLDIQPKEIKAKKDIIIEVDLSDYKEDSLIETSEAIIIPGILDVYVPDINKFYTLPFNFEVKLFYPTDTEKNRNKYILHYTAGEKVIEQDKIIKDVNPNMIDRLFNGNLKYITKPDILVMMLIENLNYKVDLVHIETIVQNMCRDEEDTFKPARLTNYKNFKIIGVKTLPFVNSFISGLIFENINKVIKTGLLSGKKVVKANPLEELIIKT